MSDENTNILDDVIEDGVRAICEVHAGNLWDLQEWLSLKGGILRDYGKMPSTRTAITRVFEEYKPA